MSFVLIRDNYVISELNVCAGLIELRETQVFLKKFQITVV